MRVGRIALALLVCLANGCGDRRAGLDVAPQVVGQSRLGNELLFVDGSRNEICAVEVMTESDRPRVARIPVKANPRLIVERSGGIQRSAAAGTGNASTKPADPLRLPTHERSGSAPAEVLVLSDGRRDAGGDFVDMPTLTVVDLAHGVRHYPLSAARGQILLSADGRYALLWGQSKFDTGNSLLNDPNRVALVDLDLPPSSENPFERTLKATGGAVTAALITHPLTINGEARPIAIFSFSDGISVWDILHKEHEEITVSGLGRAGQFQLTRVVEDTLNAQLYMVQAGESGLRVLSLGPTTRGTQNDFWPSWNQLSLGTSQASDMLQYADDSSAKVLVATGKSLNVVDANKSTVASVTLSAAATHLYGFRGASPNDNDVDRQRVLAWGEGETSVSFVELGNLETAKGQNIEQISLGSSVLSELIPLEDNLMLTVLRGGGTGTLDLESRRFRPLSSSVELSTPLIESDARRIWVGGNSGDQSSSIAFFEPNTLAVGSVRLDYRVDGMFEFESGASRKIVAVHNSLIGLMTVVDGTTVNRASARMIEGFLVDGLVDR